MIELSKHKQLRELPSGVDITTDSMWIRLTGDDLQEFIDMIDDFRQETYDDYSVEMARKFWSLLND